MQQLAIACGAKVRRKRLFAPLMAVCALSLSPLAHAVSCSVSAGNVAFGTYDPLAASPLTSTGTVTATCNGISLFGVPITVALNKGLWGTFATRVMKTGANTLNYNLYSDSAHTHIWGDGTSGTVTVGLTVNIPFLGSGSASATVYGQVPVSQDVAPGTYTDTITVTITY
jgi:spore coat protein U-like protein